MNANEKLLVAVGQIVLSAMLQEPDGDSARAAFDALVLAMAEGKESVLPGGHLKRRRRTSA